MIILPRRNRCDICNIIELCAVAGNTLNANSAPTIEVTLSQRCRNILEALAGAFLDVDTQDDRP